MAPGHGRCRLRIAGARDLLPLHVAAPERYPFLLESAAPHRVAGRYDILFAEPGRSLHARHDDDAATAAVMHELDRIDLGGEQAESLPFVGGWFLYLGYEMAGWFEPGLRLPASPHPLPDLLAVECRAAIIRDRLEDCIWLVAEDELALARLRDDLASSPALPDDDGRATGWTESPPGRFIDGVCRIREYLAAGDAFQVNLSRAWDAACDGTAPWALYRRLRRHNPAPFSGLMNWQGRSIVSTSPERLVLVDNGVIQTRPIAGTRRRGDDGAEDDALRHELLDNLKERAEHIMLIDLERNDLGRVCQPGSVEVDELMGLESYPTVHHIVSNIRGRLQPDVRTSSVLRAVFPGGTITGCPKVRVMQIIAELEGEGRGPYTGAIGYLSRHGRLDSNILIRSLSQDETGLRLRAGAGIVVDSDPEAELAETRAKASGLLRAFAAD